MNSHHRFGDDDAASTSNRWPKDRPAYASLHAAVQGEASRWNVPGIAAGFIRDGKMDVQVTGTTSLETGFPVTNDTLFQIGSISKIFTTTLVMRLVDQGKIELDAPFTTYVDDVPLANEEARNSITVRQLLSHTSGFEGDRFIDYGRGDDSLTKSIAAFDTLRQWFVPGSLWSYNNAGFYLAGYIIEKITGKTFEEAMEEEIFKPLGLERTCLLPEYAMTYAHAVGHDVDREKGPEIVRPFTYSRHIAAAGAIISSVSDMLRFAQMHMNDGELDGERIISAASAQEMRKFVAKTTNSGDIFGNSYGTGWARWEYGDTLVVGHGGSIAGFRAQLWLVPEKQWAFVVLTNGSTGSRAMSELKEWAFAREVGLTQPNPETVELSDAQLQRHAGTYLRHDGKLEVSVANGGLLFRQQSIDEKSGEPKGEPSDIEVQPLGENSFQIVSPPEAYGSVVEFFSHPAPDGTNQDLIRLGGRLASRDNEG